MTKTKQQVQREKREAEKLERETKKARCAVCGEPVSLEDRCADGLYLHKSCAYKVSQR